MDVVTVDKGNTYSSGLFGVHNFHLLSASLQCIGIAGEIS